MRHFLSVARRRLRSGTELSVSESVSLVSSLAACVTERNHVLMAHGS
jgi:urease gamma subunit